MTQKPKSLPPGQYYGTIEKAKGKHLVVKLNNGRVMSLGLNLLKEPKVIRKKPKTSPSHWEETANEIASPLDLLIQSSDIKTELRYKIKLALQRAYRSGYRQALKGDRRNNTDRHA